MNAPQAVSQPEAHASVPEAVRTSDYGCPNCLWAGCECRRGSLYKEGRAPRECGKDWQKPFCVAYVYYD